MDQGEGGSASRNQDRGGSFLLQVALPLALGALIWKGSPTILAAASAHAGSRAHHEAAPALADSSGGGHHERHRIVSTHPLVKDVVVTERYVCQIRARRHIKVCALSHGFLDEIHVREGQEVKEGDPMFKIRPIVYQTKYDAELAEVRLAELELANAERLSKQEIVSENEVALFQAKLAKARAHAKEAEAELQFTVVKAPFDGIVDRLEMQLGSLIEEREHLTTLSDNSVLWVYFNVPEARYLDYVANPRPADGSQSIELVLANGQRFAHTGQIGAIEAQFDSETGNIPFRADFPNPERLLRHGQTGNVLIHHTRQGALVIPQRATFEILDRRYVFVLDEAGVVHQRAITIGNELDDIFVVSSGLTAGDTIVLEGVRQVRDGEHLKGVEFLAAEQAMAHMKHPAI